MPARFSEPLEGVADDHVLELTPWDRKRIFNLGYYTWVEQQGVRFEDFDRRKDQRFWRGLVDSIPAWDRLIEDFNAEAGVATPVVTAKRPSVSEVLVKPYLQLREDWRGATAACARRSCRSKRRRRSCTTATRRHRRQHDVAHADGDDLGADPRRQEEPLLLAQHRLERRRPAVRLRRLRPHHHQLVQPGHSLGRVQSDAPPRRKRQGALRRMEPHGDGHALPRRRDGRAVHADPLDARLRRADSSGPKRRRSTARSPARSCCWFRRSIPMSR